MRALPYRHGDRICHRGLAYVVLASPFLDKTDRSFKVRACRLLDDDSFDLGRIELLPADDVAPERGAHKRWTNSAHKD